MKIKDLILPSAVLGGGLVLMSFFSSMKKETPKIKRPEAVKEMRVVSVEFKDNTPLIMGNGKIASVNNLALSSEVGGKIISSGFKLKNGQKFKKNEILFKVDNSIALNNYRMGISSLMNAVTQMLPDLKLDFPKAYDKWKMFFNELDFDNLPRLPKYSNSKEKIFISKYGIFSQYYTVLNLHEQLSKYIIRAPFSGSVADPRVTPGSMVSPGVSVARIIRNDIFEIEVPLEMSKIISLKVGNKAEVITSSGDTVVGKISRITDFEDNVNHTRKAVVEIRNNGKNNLIDGSYAEVVFNGKTYRSFKVPLEAIYHDGNLIVVNDVKNIERKIPSPLSMSQMGGKTKNKNGAEFKQKIQRIRAGRLNVKKVDIVAEDSEFAYVRAGIKEGELVVVQPVSSVVVGMLIKPVFQER